MSFSTIEKYFSGFSYEQFQTLDFNFLYKNLSLTVFSKLMKQNKQTLKWWEYVFLKNETKVLTLSSDHYTFLSFFYNNKDGNKITIWNAKLDIDLSTLINEVFGEKMK